MADATPIRPGVVAKGSDVVAFVNAAIADHVAFNEAAPTGAILILIDENRVQTLSNINVAAAELTFAAAYITHFAIETAFSPRSKAPDCG